MTDTITLTGLVATAPRHIVTSEGLAITSFRLASSQRRFDRAHNQWVEVDTNWYTITCFRALAINAAASVGKGDRILVTGRLRIREWESGERTGTTIEVEADALGHDLTWGTADYKRIVHRDEDTGDTPTAVQADDTTEADADNEAHDDAGVPEPVSAQGALVSQFRDAGCLSIIPVGFKTA